MLNAYLYGLKKVLTLFKSLIELQSFCNNFVGTMYILRNTKKNNVQDC